MISHAIKVFVEIWESCWFFRLNVVFDAVGLWHFLIS